MRDEYDSGLAPTSSAYETRGFLTVLGRMKRRQAIT